MILGVDWSADMAGEFGGDFADASFVHIVSRTRNPSDLTGPATVSTTSHTCKALGLSYAQRFIDGETIKRGDFQAIILRGTIDPAQVPAPGDTITVNPPGSSSSVTAKVVSVIAITEGFVTVQVRGPGT